MADASAANKADQARRFKEKHMFKKTPALAAITKRLDTYGEDIRKMEVDVRGRDDNKDVALGTSKINYMDPRISVAWCKRCEVIVPPSPLAPRPCPNLKCRSATRSLLSKSDRASNSNCT